MRLFFAFILSALSCFSFAQPGLLWAKGIGGAGGEIGNSIALDKAGNVYTTGRFTDTVDFDPGPGVFNLYGQGSDQMFICKLNAAGNFVWAKQITPAAYPTSITLDKNNNVYTTGSFIGNVDFDPGTGVFNMSSTGNYTMFISKLDAAGNFVWAKQFNSTDLSNANAVNTDTLGNVYTCGNFRGTTDFDPGTGTADLTSLGSFWDMFVCKLDSSGNFNWVKHIGSSNAVFLRNDLHADAAGNVFAAGIFSGTPDFDPGPGVFNLTSLYYEAFVLRLDASGNFAWAKNFGGPLNDACFAIVADQNKNIYTTGYFRDSADFDPGPGVYNLYAIGSPNDDDAYINKLDSSGNFVWAKSISGKMHGAGNFLDLDSCGNVFYCGYFKDTCDFDPGPNVYQLVSEGDYDVFVSKLDTAGNFTWALTAGENGADGGICIAADKTGNAFVTGHFSGTVDFDPGAGVNNITSKGSSDFFILKLGPGTCCVSSAEPDFASATPATICMGDTSILNFTGGSLGTYAAWIWYADSCGGDTVGIGSSVPVSPSVNTTYFVRAEGACNTTSCVEVSVNVLPKPIAAFTADYFPDCNGLTVKLTNQSTNADGYLWSFSDGSSSPAVNTEHQFAFNSPFTVTLIAFSSNSCADTVSVSGSTYGYLKIAVPNIFTPNNDGVNDEFKINSDTDFSDCFSIKIFNRWGIEVFSSSDPDFRWNGKTRSGQKAVAGTYFYVIEISGAPYRGFINLSE